MFKKDEFEKRLEEIAKKLKAKVEVEKTIDGLQHKLLELEKKMRKVEFPEEMRRKIDSLEERYKSLRDDVNSRMDELKASFDSLRVRIAGEVREQLKDEISRSVESESEEIQKTVERVRKKVSNIEGRMNKLVEVLETIT
jgi:exonuclease VII large subunit